MHGDASASARKGQLANRIDVAATVDRVAVAEAAHRSAPAGPAASVAVLCE